MKHPKKVPLYDQNNFDRNYTYRQTFHPKKIMGFGFGFGYIYPNPNPKGMGFFEYLGMGMGMGFFKYLGMGFG